MGKKLNLLVGLSASLLLTACGNNGDESAVSDEGGEEEVTEMTMALWDKNQEPIIREALDIYEEENENIKVELQLTPNEQYWTKMEASAEGDALPDIFWMNAARYINYSDNGFIEPIDSYLEDSDLDLADYPEGLVDLYTYEDELYGIPKDWDTSAMWYNKDIFDDAGLDYPTDEWTWDDQEEAARELNDPDEGIWGTVAYHEWQSGIWDMIMGNDGYIINDDMTKSGYGEPEAIEAMERYIGLIEDGISPDLATQTDTKPINLFSEGKVAMFSLPTYDIPNLEADDSLNIDLVQPPAMQDKATPIHGLIYAMNAQSEVKDEAWDVIEYLSGKEVGEMWAESGVVVPAHKDVLDTWVETQPDWNLQAYVDTLDYAKPFPISKNTAVWANYEKEAVVKTYTGDVSVEEGFTELSDKMDEALEKEE